VAEAYQVFESVLEVHGFAPVPSGRSPRSFRLRGARQEHPHALQEEAGGPDDGIVTQIIPLRYADPNEIKNLFTPLVSRNSVIQAYPPTNT
jgi:general secretion pathway protein D